VGSSFGNKTLNYSSVDDALEIETRMKVAVTLGCELVNNLYGLMSFGFRMIIHHCPRMKMYKQKKFQYIACGVSLYVLINFFLIFLT